MHNFEFLRGGGRFSPLGWLLPFSSLILFISYETLVSIQNSPPLSRLFTFKYFNNYFPRKGQMKSSSFDLEELNCWNKNLDTGLDASERNLDSFLHETCLLAEFSCHFGKSYLPHMTSFLAEILCVYRNVSQEAKTIEFALIGLLCLQILNF